MVDWAHRIKGLVEVHYRDAERIVLVMDTLNTHCLLDVRSERLRPLDSALCRDYAERTGMTG
jgi:hypothetical protein